MSIALAYEAKASMQKHLSVCCLCKCLGNFQKIQETKVSEHSIEIIIIIEYLWWGYICGGDKTMCRTGSVLLLLHQFWSRIQAVSIVWQVPLPDAPSCQHHPAPPPFYFLIQINSVSSKG